MNMSSQSNQQPGRAYTPWSELACELVLVALSLTVPTLSCLFSSSAHRSEWFQRSGALMVLFAGCLAYRSLTKHYQKFYNNSIRGFPLSTSRNQTIVDVLTLLVSIFGTLIWGYGDKVL
jgi:hypothetical protein